MTTKILLLLYSTVVVVVFPCDFQVSVYVESAFVAKTRCRRDPGQL